MGIKAVNAAKWGTEGIKNTVAEANQAHYGNFWVLRIIAAPSDQPNHKQNGSGLSRYIVK